MFKKMCKKAIEKLCNFMLYVVFTFAKPCLYSGSFYKYGCEKECRHKNQLPFPPYTERDKNSLILPCSVFGIWYRKTGIVRYILKCSFVIFVAIFAILVGLKACKTFDNAITESQKETQKILADAKITPSKIDYENRAMAGFITTYKKEGKIKSLKVLGDVDVEKKLMAIIEIDGVDYLCIRSYRYNDTHFDSITKYETVKK